MKSMYPYLYLIYEVKFYNEIKVLLYKVTSLIMERIMSTLGYKNEGASYFKDIFIKR